MASYRMQLATAIRFLVAVFYQSVPFLDKVADGNHLAGYGRQGGGVETVSTVAGTGMHNVSAGHCSPTARRQVIAMMELETVPPYFAMLEA